MIIERKYFDLNDKCVIEKLIIETPYKYIKNGTVFQNEACFLFIKDGESIIKSSTDKYNIQVSESVLLNCGNYFADLIQNLKDKQCEIIVVHLHLDILKEIYRNEVPNFIIPNSRKQFAHKIEQQNVILHFISNLDFYFQNPELVSDDLLKLKLKELILLLLQTNQEKNIINLFSYLFSPRQANLKKIIQTHLFSDTSISDLAMLSARSLSTFKRDFEIEYNDTPANYIKQQKLLKAANLLASTDFSISKICYEVGFNDPSHFAKLFNQKYSLTPSEYRKRKTLK